jgi:lipopolysaccharide export system ATP-binding protein
VLDLTALFRRTRAPTGPRKATGSRKALDAALGVNGRFDIFAFLRRPATRPQWVNAPAKGPGWASYFGLSALVERLLPRARPPGRSNPPGPARGGTVAPARSHAAVPSAAGASASAPSGRQPSGTRWAATRPGGPARFDDRSNGHADSYPPDWSEDVPRSSGDHDAPRDFDDAPPFGWDDPQRDPEGDGARVDAQTTLAREAQWEDAEPRARAEYAEIRPRWDDSDQAYLAVQGVEKSFVGRKVVKGVSLYVRRGEAVGLLGPNGAGKTTVFYMITGLIKADRGRIELDGHDITALPMYQRGRLGIGYLPQEASIFRGLTVEQNIRAVLEVVEPSRRKREADLDRLLDEFNITRLRQTPSIALSGGERRRVEIARALATRPSYMLLDEPFAGIDPIAVGDIQALVRHLTQRGIGVLITDHNVRETLGLTDRAYIIYSGEVLMEGNTSDIVNDPEVRRLYLGEEFRL